MKAYGQTNSAYYDYCCMIENSWTFQRMSPDEQGRCWDALHFAAEQDLLKGTYKARWGILQAVYNAFLTGIGYTGHTWRETAKDIPLF